MRIAKHFRKDQETLQRFLDVFGAGSAMLGGGNKNVQAGFSSMAAPSSMSM